MHVSTSSGNPRPERRPAIPYGELGTCVPPTPAEAAAESVTWERRGLLRRLAR